jgi:hypothetical protein
MSSGRIARHRNYSELLDRHERGVKIRRIVIGFLYFLVLLAALVLYFIVRRLETQKEPNKPSTTYVRPEPTPKSPPSLVLGTTAGKKGT